MIGEIEFPVYDVVTPQTLAEYQVRSLTYNEELKLKASIPSETNIISHLNRIVYDTIVKAPERIKSYSDFLTNTTIEDRKALIAGIYHASYGNSFVVTNVCPNCGHTLTNKITLTKTATVNFYEGEPFSILEVNEEVELPISKDVFVLRYPTLQTEEFVYKYAEDQNEELLVRSTFVKEIKTGDTVLSLEDNVYDIITRIGMLPAKDRRKLDSACMKMMTNSGISLKYKVICKECSHKFVGSIDFVAQLFRMVLE